MSKFNFYYLLLVTAWATAGLWLVGAFLTRRGISRQRTLAPTEPRAANLTDAPFVSILVPARNEAKRVLGEAISSMLRQDYERFEVVVTNDRSTDRTGEILRELRKQDERLRIVEGAELPAGWLGKPHAMEQAYQQARGAWLLATDADCVFDPRTVRTAVCHALDNGYDAVTLIPYIECRTFWERVFMPTFGWFMFVSRPVERVNDSRRTEALGVGGFFLIERSWLERVGAWQAVRAEVAEDLRLAEKLKNAGARLRVEHAPALVRTRMQTNLREIWEGFTKNLFAGTRFNIWSAATGGVAVLLFSVAPVCLLAACLVLSIVNGAEAWLALIAPLSLIYAVQTFVFAVVNRLCDVPARYAPLAPLGHLLFVLILFNSTARIISGRGVAWKGRVLYDRAGVQPSRDGESSVLKPHERKRRDRAAIR